MSSSITSPFTLLRDHSLPSLVQLEIENMILEGKLSPGAKLAEMHLAQRFGGSRGPIREAFRGLEEKSLVRVEKNRGVYVRDISLATRGKRTHSITVVGLTAVGDGP